MVEIVAGFWLALLGVLGASTFIVSRRPDARETIAKLLPYQGWIGALSALWGAWSVVYNFLQIRRLASHPSVWATFMTASVVQLALGLLLGVGVIQSFLRDEASIAKLQRTVAKIAPYQTALGLLAIGLGIWTAIAGVLY